MGIRDRIRGEFAGWQRWEVVYTAGCTLAIAVIAGMTGESVLGIASAIAGTLYTMFAGKGKISCYIFGIFNSASYGYIAYTYKLYGDAMLNIFCYLPMMFLGIACWKKQMDECDCVIKNRLDWRGRIVLVLCCAVAIVVYALILRRLGGSQAFVDSATTVFSVAAMILTVKRCIEQWLLWIAVNIISVLMWLRVYLEKGNSIAILLWWLIMLITGVIFFANWLREMRGNPEANLFPENPELESGISYCRRNPDR